MPQLNQKIKNQKIKNQKIKIRALLTQGKQYK